MDNAAVSDISPARLPEGPDAPRPAENPAPVLARSVRGDVCEVLDPETFHFATSGVRRDQWERVQDCGTLRSFILEIADELGGVFEFRKEQRWYLEVLDYLTEFSWVPRTDGKPGHDREYWDWLSAKMAKKYAGPGPSGAPDSEPYRAQRDLKYACVVIGRKMGLDHRHLSDPSGAALGEIQDGLRGFVILYLLSLLKSKDESIYNAIAFRDRTYGILWRRLREYFQDCDRFSYDNLMKWRKAYDKRVSQSGNKRSR